MPQYTNDERNIVAAEGALWAILSSLNTIHDDLSDTSWGDDVEEIMSKLQNLCVDLRTYNDQFEEEE